MGNVQSLSATRVLGPLPASHAKAAEVKETAVRIPEASRLNLASELSAKTLSQGQAAEHQAFVNQAAELPISLEATPEILPKSWQRADYDVRMAPIKTEMIETAKQAVGKAEGKYPGDMLKQYLKQTHLLGDLNFFQTSYLGTNSKDKLYIVADGTNDVEKTFHHELSSILLRQHPEYLDQAAWNNTLPKGFEYGGGTVAAHRSGMDSLTLERSEARQGFVCDYSRASQENDFNMIAENLFDGNQTFWKTVDRNPMLRKKVELVVQFYEKLDSRLNADYFRTLGR